MPEFFGQRVARFADGLLGVLALADFLLVESGAQQRQGRILRRAAAAAARVRAATAAALAG